jgi:hypothetical protein
MSQHWSLICLQFLYVVRLIGQFLYVVRLIGQFLYMVRLIGQLIFSFLTNSGLFFNFMDSARFRCEVDGIYQLTPLFCWTLSSVRGIFDTQNNRAAE